MRVLRKPGNMFSQRSQALNGDGLDFKPIPTLYSKWSVLNCLWKRESQVCN